MHSRLLSDNCLSTGGNGLSPALSLSLTRRQELAFSCQNVLPLQEFKWCSFIFNMEQNQTLMSSPFSRRQFSILALQRLGERWFLWNVPCIAIFTASLHHAGSPALLQVGLTSSFSALYYFHMVCKGKFFKNWHCCKGWWVILPFYAHKTHSKMWGPMTSNNSFCICWSLTPGNLSLPLQVDLGDFCTHRNIWSQDVSALITTPGRKLHHVMWPVTKCHFFYSVICI